MKYTADDIRKIRMGNGDSTSSLSSVSKKYTADDIRKMRANASFDLEDVNRSNEIIKNTFGGWQDQDTMKANREIVSNTWKNIINYKNNGDFTKEQSDYLESLSKSYTDALGSWNDTANLYNYYQNADAFSKAMEKQKDASKPIYEEKYSALTKNEDFADNSVTNAKNAKGIDTALWSKEEKDAWRNSPYFYDNVIATYTSGLSLDDLDDEKKAVGSYIFNTQGAEAYKEYMKDISMDVSKQLYDDKLSKYKDFATEHPLINAAATSAFSSVVAPLAGLQTMTQGLVGEANPYRGASGLYNQLNDLNAESIQTIKDNAPNAEILGMNVPGVLTEALTSGLQSRLGQRLFGTTYNVIMGTGAFASAYKEAKERGLDDTKSLLMAGVSGLTEYATEQLGMEWVFGKKGGKSILTNILTQAGAEGLEEIVGDAITAAYDNIVNGDQSQTKMEYQEYIDRGFSKAEASKMVRDNFIKEMAEGALAAAISAGVEGLAHTVTTSNMGKNVDREMYANAIKSLGEDSEAYKNFTELTDKFGDDLSGAKSFSDNWKIGHNIEAAFNEGSEKYKELRKNARENYLKGNKEAYDVNVEEANRLNKSMVTLDTSISKGKSEIEDALEDFKDNAYKSALTEVYDGQDVQKFTNAARLIQSYAQLGIDVSEAYDVVGDDVMNKLTINKLYNTINRINDIKTNVINNKELKYAKQFKKAGNFDITALKDVKLTQNEKRLSQVFRMFSRMGMNIKLIADASDTSVNGLEKDGSIVINLRARYNNTARSKGRDAKGEYVLPTFGHESTHWMENILGTEFGTFKDVLKEYAGEKQWSDFVSQEMKRGNLKSIEVAESEVVARMCEDMLNNTDTIDRIIAVADESKVKRIIARIRLWFNEIKADIDELMKGYSSDSEEARWLAHFENEFKEVQNMWIDMFQKALVVNQVIEYTDNQTEEKKFNIKSTVETSGNLMALHNLNEEELVKTIKLGGFALPSIAIKKQYMPHTDFGNVTIVFSKDTIDPIKTDVYSSDAYTVSFPRIEKKLSEKKVSAIRKEIEGIVGGREEYNKIGNMVSLDYDNMTDFIERRGNAYEAYKDEKAIKYAYLKSKGMDISIPMKDRKYLQDLSNEALGAIALTLGDEELTAINNDSYNWFKNNADEVDRIKVLINEAFYREHERENISPKLQSLYKNYYSEDDGSLSWSTFEKVTRAMNRLRNGGEQILDSEAFDKMLNEYEYGDDYKEWIENLFDGVVEKEGFRNNVDYFTPNGNRRSWEALHWELNLENVVKWMKSQPKTGADAFFGADALFGVSTIKFKDMEDMKKRMGMLYTQKEEERDAQRKEFFGRLSDICDEIITSDSFSARDGAGEAIVEAIQHAKTVSGIDRYMRKNFSNFLNIKDDTAQKVYDLYQDILKMPTEYFEAKPNRAVGLNEIAYAVVPSNVSDKTLKLLNDNNIAYKTYKSGDNEDRVKVVNENADISKGTLFSNKVDSEGNALSEDQAEFFADSQIRDKDGNLQVMYHASPRQFTVFDISKASYAGHFGKGFYFADTALSHFGKEVYKCYLNIKNPIRYDTGEASFTEEQLRKFITAIAENEDYGIDNYGEGYQIDWLVEDFLGQDNYYIINDINASCVGDFVATVKLFNEVNGTDFDGIVASTETVAFYSNQIKLVNNLAPTENDDIRYNQKVDDTFQTLSKEASKKVHEMVEAGKGVSTLSGYSIVSIRNKMVYSRLNEIERVVTIYTDDNSTLNRIKRKIIDYENSEQYGSSFVQFLKAMELLEGEHEYSFKLEFQQDSIPDRIYGKRLKRSVLQRPTGNTRIVEIRRGDNAESSRPIDYKHDSNGKSISDGQQKYFRNSAVRDDLGRLLVVYHGTYSKAFSKFNENSGIWLTPVREYALEYSDVAYGDEASDEKASSVYDNTSEIGVDRVYALYADIKNPVKVGYVNGPINNYFVQHLSNALGIDNKADYKELLSIAEEHKGNEAWYITNDSRFRELAQKYHFDGIAAYEGESEFIPTYCAFSSKQVKHVNNTNPTSDQDILFSNKVDENDLLGLNKQLEKDNEKLKKDVMRLTRRLRLEGQVTKGKVLDDSQLELVAKRILRNANKSDYPLSNLILDLRRVYGYIIDNSGEEGKEIDWDEMMGMAYEVAYKVRQKSKPIKIEDDYFKMIFNDIRAAKIKLNDEQIQEAKNAYGDQWRREYLGRINLTKNGRSLDSYWSEWSEQYPNIFDSSVNPNDQIVELSEIYDAVREGSTQYEKVMDDFAIRETAVDIYDKFWSVPTLTTISDKYESEIKRLKFEHREEVRALKQELKNRGLADAMHYKAQEAQSNRMRDEKLKAQAKYYQDVIKRIRDEKNQRMAEYREKVQLQKRNAKELAERRALVNQITDTSKTLMDWMRKNNGKTGEAVPEALKVPVSQLLSAIDYSSKQYLGLIGGQSSGMPTKKDISLRKAIENINKLVSKSTVDGFEELGMYVDFPPNYQEDVERIAATVNAISARVGEDNVYVLNEMTSEDLQELNMLVKTMKKTVQNLNKRIADANARTIAATAQDTILELNELGMKKYGKGDKFKSFINWKNALPIYAFRHMGDSAYSMFEELQNGWDKFAFNVQEIKEYAQNVFNGKQRDAWSNDVKDFDVLVLPTKTEEKRGGKAHNEHIQMTTAQVMSLYCLSKREHAIGHISNGGIKIRSFGEGKDKVVQNKNIRLSQSAVEDILSSLTKEQIEVADKLQEFMNTTCSDWGNEVSMKRYGIKGFTEKHYFPIKVDSNVLATESKDKEKSLYALLNMSFTKPLTERASNQIEIGDIFDVFTKHTSEMAKYNAMALPLLDTIKWYNYKEKDADGNVTTLKGTLENAFGADAKTYIVGFLEDINGNQESGRDEDIFSKATKRYKVAAVAGNLQVAALQPISYVRMLHSMDIKYLAKGLLGNNKKGRSDSKKYSGIAVWKEMSLFDTNISRGLDKMISQSETPMEAVVEKAMSLAGKMDDFTWGSIWNACKAEVRDKTDLSGESLNEATAKRFREIVYTTQVVDSTMTRSTLMRDKSQAVQWATSFMSEPTVAINMLTDAAMSYSHDYRKTGNHGEAFKRNGKKILRASFTYVLGAAVESAFRTAFMKFRDSDKDGDELVEALWREFLEQLNPLANLPIFRDFVSIWQGYSVERPDMQFAEYLKKAVTGFENRGLTYKTFFQAMQALSYSSGLPIANTLREVRAIWNDTIALMYPDLKWDE